MIYLATDNENRILYTINDFELLPLNYQEIAQQTKGHIVAGHPTEIIQPQGKIIEWYYDGNIFTHKFVDIPPAPQTEHDLKLDELQAKLDYLAVMTGNEEVL